MRTRKVTPLALFKMFPDDSTAEAFCSASLASRRAPHCGSVNPVRSTRRLLP